MKKFMFSAVALVAFSVSGMASTGEENLMLKDLSLTTVVVKKNCDKLANDVMDAYEANGYTVEEAYEYGLTAYTDCLGN